MGISKPSVEFMLTLFKAGHFKGLKTVIELGAQDLHFQPRERLCELLKERLDMDQALIAKEFDKALNKSTVDDFSPDWLYRLLGFEIYHCADADGRHNAFVWDLNTPIPEEYKGKYDLLTDHGTSEHVFNVYQSFKNIHDLTHKGSIIIQMLPFQGHVDHGFFNFQPCFFEDLAFENDYEIIEKSAVIYDAADNAETARIIPYSRDKFKEEYYKTKSSEAIIAMAMKRNSDKDFRVPFHGIYGSTCLIPSYKRSFVQHWIQKMTILFFKGEGSVGRRMVRLKNKLTGGK